MTEIVNRVKSSGLLAIDLSEFIPKQDAFIGFDFKEHLWNEMILKEKDFRAFLKEADWTLYKDKHVYLFCSVEAIFPSWAYVLLSSQLVGLAKTITIGTLNDARQTALMDYIENMELEKYEDAKIIVKGCSDLPNTDLSMIAFVGKVQPVCSSIMFGEPCSTVPIFKRRSLSK